MPSSPVQIPKYFTDAVASVAQAGAGTERQQVQALRELFDLFTTDRAELGRQAYLDQPRLRAAYLGYHLPLNVARAMYVLAQVRARYEAVDQLRSVIDLGGGPGTAAWATLLSLAHALSPLPLSRQGSGEGADSVKPPSTIQRPAIQARVFDQSGGALGVGRQIAEKFAGQLANVELNFTKHALPALPQWEGPAVVWLAMVVNELLRNRRFDLARFAGSLGRRCAPGSVLIVMEPALRKPGRDLLALHDLLLETGDWDVIAPCTHQSACPLLKLRDRSWCHFRFHWDVPTSVQRLAEPLGLECQTPAVAYVALVRRNGGPSSLLTPLNKGRVIGDPMAVATGGRGVYVCHEGRREVLSPVESGVQRGDLVKPTRRVASDTTGTTGPKQQRGPKHPPRGNRRRKPL